MSLKKNLIGVMLILSFSANSLATVSGSDTYFAMCAGCHQKNGEGIPSVFPSLKSSVVVTTSLQDMVNIVVKGKRGTAMQAFGLQLSQSQLSSVIAHVRNKIGKIATTEKDIAPLVKKATKELNDQIERDNNQYKKLKTELNNITSPSSLFAKSFSYEKSNIPLAQEGYNLLIQKYPDSNLMLKAIERLDKIKTKHGR